jgi:Flp pilus assembly protein TadG
MRTVLQQRLSAHLRRFRQDEGGFISIEAIIVFPLLLWVFMALFVYWDAYRAENTSIKSTYVIADMISRENVPVNMAYINGMHQVFRYMNATDEDTWIRVTSVQYRQSDNTYRVIWSRSTNTTRAPVHTHATLATQRHRLPLLADQDAIIIVESWRRFTPAFQVGLDRRTFDEFTIIRPRLLFPLPIS